MNGRDLLMIFVGGLVLWGIQQVRKVQRLWREPEPPVVVAVLDQILDTQQLIVKRVDGLTVRVGALEAR